MNPEALTNSFSKVGLVEEGRIFVKLIFGNHLSIEMISKDIQYSELPQT